jgi:nucleotide-binding universal stress UspA family protein
MKMPCRILVPLDGSAGAEAALPEVERIAVGGAEVHLLHVVPSLPHALGSASAGVMEIQDQALAYLDGVRERLPDLRGLNLIRSGDPAVAVLQVALELNIDLIAMCTHARTGLARWLLGSVAETVVRRAQLPVLLIRPGLPPPRTVLRRILVPLDGSEESFSIMTAVKRMALRTGAEVVLLHVNPRVLVPVPPPGPPATPEVAEDPGRELLTAADRQGLTDFVFWQVSAEGDAVEEILRQSTMQDADLIAMCTHARSGRDWAVFGSVAQAVLERSDRAVLLQKPVVRAIPAEAGRSW